MDKGILYSYSMEGTQSPLVVERGREKEKREREKGGRRKRRKRRKAISPEPEAGTPSRGQHFYRRATTCHVS